MRKLLLKCFIHVLFKVRRLHVFYYGGLQHKGDIFFKTSAVWPCITHYRCPSKAACAWHRLGSHLLRSISHSCSAVSPKLYLMLMGITSQQPGGSTDLSVLRTAKPKPKTSDSPKVTGPGPGMQPRTLGYFFSPSFPTTWYINCINHLHSNSSSKGQGRYTLVTRELSCQCSLKNFP